MVQPDLDSAWKMDLVNEVGHALNGVVGSLRIQVDTLARRLRRGDPPGATLERLEREMTRLERTLQNMLLYGRPLVLNAQPMDLRAKLREIAEAHRTGCAEPRAEVVFEDAGAPQRVTWDEARLKIVLNRIIENAAQHTDPPHPMVLRAEAGPPGVILSVSDRGTGIPEERLPHVLEPFYPQHHGRAGLGLAVADKLVRAHGGRIEISSQPGRGTTVRLLLPLEPPG